MDYFTWEYLATYGGMTALVTVVTQLVKWYLPKVDPKWIALGVALLGQIAVQLIYLKDFSVGGIALALVNVICVLLGSVGAYESVVKPIQNAAAKSEDGDA